MYLYSKEEYFQKYFKQCVLKSCLFCCDLSLAPFLSYVTETSEDLATRGPQNSHSSIGTAEAWAPPQASWAGLCILTKSLVLPCILEAPL